jgi:hypothetical protein
MAMVFHSEWRRYLRITHARENIFFTPRRSFSCLKRTQTLRWSIYCNKKTFYAGEACSFQPHSSRRGGGNCDGALEPWRGAVSVDIKGRFSIPSTGRSTKSRAAEPNETQIWWVGTPGVRFIRKCPPNLNQHRYLEMMTFHAVEKRSNPPEASLSRLDHQHSPVWMVVVILEAASCEQHLPNIHLRLQASWIPSACQRTCAAARIRIQSHFPVVLWGVHG